MRTYTTLLILFASILLGFEAEAQVTNLKVNGQSSNFTLLQDIGMSWDCDLPVGGTATIEVWLHVSGNTFIDQATDKSIFGTFSQTDGDTKGNNGPNDMDGTVNGHLNFNVTTLILAPGNYILKFTNNNVVTQISGTVVAMSSPAYTVMGKYTPASGMTAQNILIKAMNINNDYQQAYALTDNGGNYVLNLTSASQGATVKVSLQDNIQPYVASPADTSIIITKSYTGINFNVIPAAAKIVGYLKTDAGGVLANIAVRCKPNENGNDDTKKTVYTDANGYYAFGFTSSECTSYPIWKLEINAQLAPTYVAPVSGDISIHTGDSLQVDLLAYVANSTITGKVLLDGQIPTGKSMLAVAVVDDTVASWSYSDETTGAFTIYVTSKLSSYQVGITDLEDAYSFEWNNTNQYAPGSTGIELNVVTVAWNAQTEGNKSYELNCVAFPTSTVGFTGGSSGNLLGTTNGGATWSTLTSNSTADIKSICFINSSTGWFGGTNGVIKKTTNGGASWAAQNSTISYPINVIQFTDANNGWAMNNDYFLRTTNGGTTWSTVTTGPSETMTSFYMLDASNGYMLTGWGNAYKTADGGTSWTLAGDPGHNYSKIKFSTANVGYTCGFGSSIEITTDGGTTWSYTSLNSNQLNDIFPISATTAVVVGESNTIYKTTNTGTTWVKQPLNSNNNYSFNAVCFTDANKGWAVGSNGIILNTTNGGTVDVRTEHASGKPAAFELSQNYPNPFNPSTVIEYAVPQNTKANHVTLKIFNVLGQQVAVLVNEEKAAGYYSATFNAKNLPSGIYLYSLQVGNQGVTKKMLLLK